MENAIGNPQLFYMAEAADLDVPLETSGSENGLTCELWRPSSFRMRPKGFAMVPFAVWWWFHQFRLFRNRDYSILVFRQGDKVVHRTCVFPGYFRFPFMAKNDLQIGDTWTDPAARGQGLATKAIGEVLRRTSAPRYWYLVDQENAPSIRVIEKSGFQNLGTGVRTKRWGLRVLGAYRLQGESS